MASSRCSVAASFLALVLLLSGCFLDAGPLDSAGAGATGGGGAGATVGSAGSGGGGAGTGEGATGAGGAATTSTSTPPPECLIDGDCTDEDPSPCVGPLCQEGKCATQPANQGQECGEKSDCNDPPLCEQGVCVPKPRPDGELAPGNTGNDCKTKTCQGGTVQTMDNNDDKPDDTSCKAYTCDAGTLLISAKNEGGECLFGSGTCCAGKCCDGNCNFCL